MSVRHTQLSWRWKAFYILLHIIWWAKKFPFWENQRTEYCRLFMNFDYHEKLLFLFNHADRYICKLTAGFVLPALEKRTNHTVVINLQILLLYYIFSFCSSSLLVICYDYISHAILLEMGIVKSSCCCCCCCFFGKCASYDSFNRVVVISWDFSIYNPLLK